MSEEQFLAQYYFFLARQEANLFYLVRKDKIEDKIAINTVHEVCSALRKAQFEIYCRLDHTNLLKFSVGTVFIKTIDQMNEGGEQ